MRVTLVPRPAIPAWKTQRVMAIGPQPFGGLLGLGPGPAIDDAGARAIAGGLDEGPELGAFLLARRRADEDVRPVEAAAEDRAVSGKAQLGADILDRARIGGRGQCQPGDLGEAVRQHPEAAVFRPEMMAPLADAMRLVDGEEGDAAVSPPSPRQGAVEGPARSGGDIQQLDGAALRQVAADLALPGPRARSECSAAAAMPCWRSAATWSSPARSAGRPPTPSPSRHSAGTWKQSDLPPPVGISTRPEPARHHMVDDLLLPATETGMAEDAVEHLGRVGAGQGRRRELPSHRAWRVHAMRRRPS